MTAKQSLNTQQVYTILHNLEGKADNNISRDCELTDVRVSFKNHRLKQDFVYFTLV